jgi:dCMP deaminase
MNEVGCIHAEMNAIFHCARLGRSTRGATLVSSVQPCLGCAKAIVASGIKKVITRETGYVGEGVELLRAEGVTVEFLGTVESIQPSMERKASCFAVGYGC